MTYYAHDRHNKYHTHYVSTFMRMRMPLDLLRTKGPKFLPTKEILPIFIRTAPTKIETKH